MPPPRDRLWVCSLREALLLPSAQPDVQQRLWVCKLSSIPMIPSNHPTQALESHTDFGGYMKDLKGDGGKEEGVGGWVGVCGGVCVCVRLCSGMAAQERRQINLYLSRLRNWMFLTFQLGVVYSKHVDGHKL